MSASAARSIQAKTRVFARPDDTAAVDIVDPSTGRGRYSGKTLDQLRAEYPGVIETSLDQHCASVAARQRTPIGWRETTAERFEEQLCAVPPEVLHGESFLVGEPIDRYADTGEARYAAYRYSGGRYETASRPLTVREFYRETGGGR